MSFSIAEDELRSMDAESMKGDYAAWNYFQSIDRKENARFVARFKAKYGADRVTDDPIEAGYFGVHLWAQAVRDTGTDEVSAVRRALRDQTYAAPEGLVSVDGDTMHTWKTVRVGRITDNGQFEVVWTSQHPVRPVPFPVFKSKTEWEQFLTDLYEGWGENCAAPPQPQGVETSGGGELPGAGAGADPG